MRLQGGLSIERMCQLAQVSRAGFYRSFQEQEPQQEEMELRATIQQVFLENRRRYGYRRVTKELRRRGWVVNRKRVERLMKEDNLLAVQPRAFITTTNSEHECEVYLNLAKRMKLTGINQLWVADITYIRLQGEFVYLAVILDAFSRKVVGWELDRKMTCDLTKTALQRALAARQPAPGLVHHSDRGVQYAAREYINLLAQHQLIPSMSRPANPYDNASCESFMKTLKREEIYAGDYRDLEDLRQHLEEFIDRYYNRVRLHSALGYQPPEEFEQSLVPGHTGAAATMSFFRHKEDYRPDVGSVIGSGPQTTPGTIGCDESPAGYSLASCSPAELASASPAEHHSAAVPEL
ncbi:MAG TPA: IS3 family transposase [Pyrinomonadaceae bacterium]|jgi:transposase InsO family protein|nr:IS3 family transposase [Pyrinomonadaceae bacterium]